MLRNVKIHNRFLFISGQCCGMLTILILLAPVEYINTIKQIGFIGQSLFLLYLVEQSHFVFLIAGMILIDYSVKGTWWKRNS